MELTDSWRLIGSVQFNHPRTDLTVALFRLLNNRIVKVKTTSSTRKEWRRGCYMKATVENVEVDNRLVPLNQESIFQLSQFATSYALVFTPVRWLPNITIWVWEYTGVEPDALQTDLERIESKIDNLSA